MHPRRATIPALASCAAQRQRKFMKMYNAIFNSYGQYSQADMDGHARKLRLNMKKFKTDINRCKTQVRKEQLEMARVGARGTPAFFINGRFLSGNQPYANFKTLIDEVLRKAKLSRIRASRYYNTVIVGLGKNTL